MIQSTNDKQPNTMQIKTSEQKEKMNNDKRNENNDDKKKANVC